MRNILVAIILLATCGAARAEFTFQEKAEVVKLIQAHNLSLSEVAPGSFTFECKEQ